VSDYPVIQEDKKNMPWTMGFGVLLCLTILWLCVILYSYPLFQAARALDPYANVNTFIPQFCIFTAFFIMVILVLYRKFSIGKWMNLGMLSLSAVVLWFTPYLMAGWVKQTDTLWHLGMAANAGDILHGLEMPFSSYTTSFPISYMFGNLVCQVTGLELQVLGNYVLPLFFTFLFTLFIYLILVKFFSRNSATLATLMSIGLLHYVELHMSPHVIGLVILFTCLLLLSRKQWIIAILLGIGLLPLTHTVSFGFFILFLALYFIYQMGGMDILYGKRDSGRFSRRLLLLIIGLGAIGAAFVLTFTSLSKYGAMLVESLSLSKLFYFVAENLLHNPWFKVLSTVIYIGIFVLFCFLAIRHVPHFRGKRFRIAYLPRVLARSGSMMPLFALGCLALGILVASVLERSVMIERGLTIFMIIGSGFIVTGLLSSKDKRPWLMVLIAALFVTYPFASYPVDNYNTFPVSEEAGMNFLSGMELTDAIIDMPSPGQLDAFTEPGMNISTFINNSQTFSIVVFRLSAAQKYFIHTGDDDRYYYKFERLERDNDYSVVYCNPSFKIFTITQSGVNA